MGAEARLEHSFRLEGLVVLPAGGTLIMDAKNPGATVLIPSGIFNIQSVLFPRIRIVPDRAGQEIRLSFSPDEVKDTNGNLMLRDMEKYTITRFTASGTEPHFVTIGGKLVLSSGAVGELTGSFVIGVEFIDNHP
ncbi:hypothetical protein [Desulfobotulus alkaliphilus]|nr:hypothetical protein [Desulfobotulus alkaliphilus]